MTDEIIATMLGVTRATSSKHVANAMQKLSAATRTEAVVRAIGAGIVSYPL